MTRTTTFTIPRARMSAWRLRELAAALSCHVRLRPHNPTHYFATVDTQEPRIVTAIMAAIGATL
jgi:hypothetical protein